VYRDAGGGENITTTAQSLSWDTEVSENAQIPLDGTNTSFDLSAHDQIEVKHKRGYNSMGQQISSMDTAVVTSVEQITTMSDITNLLLLSKQLQEMT